MKNENVQFLYPTAEQFPFDRVCGQIVRELEARNWTVPGITAVEFHNYGTGEQKFRNVSSIEGSDFALRFCRTQRSLPGGRWNDIAAVTQINIPRQEIHVYEDESGPAYHLYVGDNWERDQKTFTESSKFNSKLRGEPRLYLTYKGTGYKNRTRYLVHTNDLGREYEPDGKEPTRFETEAVFQGFKQYLEETVLPAILAHPVPAVKLDFFAKEVIPFPASVGPLFCFGEQRDVGRIEEGKTDPNSLEPGDRYGMQGNGWRLVSLDVPKGDFPNVAYEGFLWCGLTDTAEIPGHSPGWGENFTIRVTPNRANDIYIADHDAYETAREGLVGRAVLSGRDRLTNAEVAQFVQARAKTIIPISEYKGNFKQPVVLIQRELDLDEVEVLGPRKGAR